MVQNTYGLKSILWTYLTTSIPPAVDGLSSVQFEDDVQRIRCQVVRNMNKSSTGEITCLEGALAKDSSSEEVRKNLLEALSADAEGTTIHVVPNSSHGSSKTILVITYCARHAIVITRSTLS